MVGGGLLWRSLIQKASAWLQLIYSGVLLTARALSPDGPLKWDPELLAGLRPSTRKLYTAALAEFSTARLL